MARPVCYVGSLLVGWIFAFDTGFAQPPVLQINAERLKYVRDVEQRAVAKNDSLLLAEAYYQYGGLYHSAGDNFASKSYYLKAIRILEPRGDSFELGQAYLQLGTSLNVHADSRDDIRYVNRALKVFERIRSLKGMAKAYALLGGMYHWRWAGYETLKNNPAKYDSIAFCYRKVEQLGEQLRDTALITEGKARMAGLFMTFKDRRAIKNLRWVLDWNERKKRDTARVHIMLDLVSAYMEFDELRAGGRLLNQARQLYNDKHYNEYTMLIHLSLVSFTYYKKAGQWQQAFENLKVYNSLINEQLHTKRDGFAAWLTEEYEREKKEDLLKAQNSKLALETENLRMQQRFTLATSALFVVAAGMSLVFFRLNRKNQRISRWNEELVREQNHRVKNNLQVVSSLLSLQASRLTDEAVRQAVEESRLRVESMAILHRRLYDGEMLAVVNLGEFIREVTGEVLNTFGYSFLPVEYAVDEISLSADKATPLGLVLNELVTNACKYAFPGEDDPTLSISCRRVVHRLRLEVTDNGPGLNGAELTLAEPDDLLPPRHRSFGMMLIQTQVAQLHGTGGFSTPAGKGTRFTLEFNA